MNTKQLKRLFLNNRTLQNLALALMLFAVLDIVASCVVVSYLKNSERQQIKEAAQSILDTPDLVSMSQQLNS
jgi:cbb3-type cytochrome oxidase subunit 3